MVVVASPIYMNLKFRGIDVGCSVANVISNILRNRPVVKPATAPEF